VHPQADSGKLIRAHERLYELHPEDPQLRQSLQALLERAGRIEDAVKLATTTPAVTPAECVGAFAPPASGALHGRAEAIRIRMRAAQPDKALAETAKLGAIANQAGIGAHLAAAQLYLELGATGRATQAIDRAAQKARSREDQRQVAFVRERMLAGKGRTAELKGLYQAWSRSEDPCLRLAAAQREQQAGGLAVGPSMLPPPMP
jgi:tetratricopeptide (TPR) repeat protein